SLPVEATSKSCSPAARCNAALKSRADRLAREEYNMRRSDQLRILFGGMCGALALQAGAAQAQTPAAPAGTAARQAPDLGEVVVTSRRREENLQNVPVAVTALTADTLNNLNVRTTNDLNGIAAGLNVESQGRREEVVFTMRGQTKNFGSNDAGAQA